MDALPEVSAVICTRNRPDTIRQAVESVLANDHPSFDVVVVDQSTTTATRDLLAPLAAEQPRLRYQHVDRPGLSRAYNIGIRATTSGVIACTDDDCVVPRDWLTRIAGAFAQDPEAGLLYGQVFAARGRSRPSGIIPDWKIPRAARLGREDAFKICGMGANFAVRRATFDRLGGFDEVLGGGAPLASTQDFDFAYRVFLAGGVIILRPEVVVDHYGARLPQEWPATLRSYGIGMGGFYAKHVRCGDRQAIGLSLRHFLRGAAVEGLAALRGRDGDRLLQSRAFLAGVRRSLAFPIDRRRRLYVAP
jgi:GT2 family glycosyltransferase